MPLPVVFLTKAGSDRKVGCVYFHSDGFLWVEQLQHGVLRACFLQVLEGSFLPFVPMKFCIFLCKVCEGHGLFRVFFNKLPVVIGKAQESLYVLNVSWLRLVLNRLDFR